MATGVPEVRQERARLIGSEVRLIPCLTLCNLLDVVDTPCQVIDTGPLLSQVPAHGRVGVQRLRDFEVSGTDFVDSVAHPPVLIYLEPVRLHAEILLDVLHHGISVVNEDPYMMHKIKHALSLTSPPISWAHSCRQTLNDPFIFKPLYVILGHSQPLHVYLVIMGPHLGGDP